MEGEMEARVGEQTGNIDVSIMRLIILPHAICCGCH